MAMAKGAWVQERNEQRSTAQRLLDAAKKHEHQLLHEGWKWYTMNGKTKILVPCDKDGKPTREGLEMIRINKEKLESLD